MDVGIKGILVEVTRVVINTTVAQDTSHEDKNNEYEDDDIIKIADKNIPEEDVHHPQLVSTTV